MDPNTTLRPVSKTTYVYEWLRNEIAKGRFAPGQRIRQQEVAEELGVSYTPIREAFRRLEATGLVLQTSGRGVQVNHLQGDAVRELFLLRGELEGLAARLAVQAAAPGLVDRLRGIQEQMQQLARDRDVSGLATSSRIFHAEIARAGGPAVIAQHIEEIWDRFPVPVSHSKWADPDFAAATMGAHARLIDTIEAGHADDAAELMRAHILHSLDSRTAEQAPA